MAYTKIHAIKTTLVKALDYIENPEKTEEQLLVSGYNVDPLTASMEFTMTRVMAKNMIGERGGKKGSENLAYHLIQSFSPDDNVTPEQAHELGRRLANELLGGRFEYVISTHVDRAHIHNHIIFNATSFYDFRKFHTPPGQIAIKIRGISDRICAEADLSVIRAEQFGRTYQYNTPKYGPSWKRQIRQRLQFVLQVSGSFEEFLDGAARLGVTVDASGKHVTYRMEGQQRATRDRSLDKEGTFTREGIEARIEAGNEVRERLKQDIREAAAHSSNCREFQAELHRRGVEMKQTRRFGARYSVDGDTVMMEWSLGPAYSTEAIQAALRGAEDAFIESGSAMDRLEEEFQKTGRNASNDVGVRVSREQVLKATADGILVSVPDEKTGGQQLIFIDHNHVTYHRDTDSFTVYVGNGYSYYAGTPDGERTDIRVRGEDIIRVLELAGGVQPERVEVIPEDIGRMSPKGLMLAIPELGIRSLFIEDRFMEYDPTGKGARAALYANWSYQFQDADGATRYVSGRELTAALHKRQEMTSGKSLLSRINAMQRRDLLAETDKLADALLLMRRQGIRDMDGFAVRLESLREKQASLQASIKTIQTRNKAYQSVAKQLVTYHDYLPVKLQSMELSGKARRSYELTHEAELSAWSFAEGQLEKSGVRPEVDPEKVLALVAEQERELAELKAQANKLAEQAKALEDARDTLEQVQEDGQQQDRARSREHEQEL